MFNAFKHSHSCCSSDIYIHVTANILGLTPLCISVHLQGRGWLTKPIPLFFVPERSTLFLEYLKLFTEERRAVQGMPPVRRGFTLAI